MLPLAGKFRFQGNFATTDLLVGYFDGQEEG
jgi:hypothetical protein